MGAGGWAIAIATQDAATVISGSYTEARKLAQQLQASRMAACCLIGSNKPDQWARSLTLVKAGTLLIGT